VDERNRQFAGIRNEQKVVEAFVRAWKKGNLLPIPVRPALEEPELPELAEAL